MTETHYTHHDQTELEKLLRHSRPWFEKNGTVVIYGLAALFAIAAVFIYIRRQPAGNVDASRELLLATQPEQYRDVADNFPDTKIAVWSRLRQGDRLLDNAVTNMFMNRPVGMEELDQAEAAYKRLAERRDIEDSVRERVLIGLARVTEARCDGSDASAEAAISAWKRVVDEFRNSLVKDYAETRIEELATADSKAFYKWFHQQNPVPVDPGLAPGQPPVPGMPSLNIPATPKASEPEPKPAEPKPAEAKEAKPAAEAPAETAAEKKTDEKPAESAEAEKKEPSAEAEKKEEPAASGAESKGDAADTAAPAEKPDAEPAAENKPEQAGESPK